METEDGTNVRNAELRRLLEELTARRGIAPDRRDARVAADIELLQRRLEMLARAGVAGEPSPYLSFLERTGPSAPKLSVAASA